MTAFSRLLNGSDTSAVPGNLKLRQNTKDKLIKLRQNTKDKLQLLLQKKTGKKKTLSCTLSLQAKKFGTFLPTS